MAYRMAFVWDRQTWDNDFSTITLKRIVHRLQYREAFVYTIKCRVLCVINRTL